MLQIQSGGPTPPADITQSVYVTLTEKQTVTNANYLVGLTSQSSGNSIFFIPSEVDSNARYSKLTFTTLDPTDTPEPVNGRFSFYDSEGGYDTYPMGFYKYVIHEQASSTNLNPQLSGAIIESGLAYIYAYGGNFTELTSAFTEYAPTLEQYVYPG